MPCVLFLFSQNFGCAFSMPSTVLTISQQWLVWLTWNKKEMHMVDTAWTMWHWPLTSPMTLTLDFPRSNFEIKNCISGIVGLVDVKWKSSKSVRYWNSYMTLLFDHTHDLDLEVSRLFEIALLQGWGGRLTWNERNVRVSSGQGKVREIPDLGKVREFCWRSGKKMNIGKSQGICI